jgi:hypothetical protein
LTYEDIRAIKQKSWIELGIASIEQMDKVLANGVEREGKVTATMPDEIKFYDLKTIQGQFLSDEDVESAPASRFLAMKSPRFVWR